MLQTGVVEDLLLLAKLAASQLLNHHSLSPPLRYPNFHYQHLKKCHHLYIIFIPVQDKNNNLKKITNTKFQQNIASLLVMQCHLSTIYLPKNERLNPKQKRLNTFSVMREKIIHYKKIMSSLKKKRSLN